MGPIGFSETSVRNYHSVLGKIKKKHAWISFTTLQKPAITHCSGSLPMWWPWQWSMSLHHNMMLRGVCW